jgi:hypothetical protein
MNTPMTAKYQSHEQREQTVYGEVVTHYLNEAVPINDTGAKVYGAIYIDGKYQVDYSQPYFE